MIIEYKGFYILNVFVTRVFYVSVIAVLNYTFAQRTLSESFLKDWRNGSGRFGACHPPEDLSSLLWTLMVQEN